MWQTPVINYFKLVESYERQLRLELSKDEWRIPSSYTISGFSEWLRLNITIFSDTKFKSYTAILLNL